VLGFTSPAIAVAPEALAVLTDRELDHIIVHEWAHVQRRDDVARLVQRIVAAFAGLHPAVWWIDRQLHREREAACDDWAVNAAGSARDLALSLTKLAALPVGRADAVLAPAAVVTSELRTRVVRLLDRNRNGSTRWTFGAPMIVVPVIASLAVTLTGVELVVTAPTVPARAFETTAIVSPGPDAPVPAPSRGGAGSQPVQARVSFEQPSGTQRPRAPQRAAPHAVASASDPQPPGSSSAQGAGTFIPTLPTRPDSAAPIATEQVLDPHELPGPTTAIPEEVVASRAPGLPVRREGQPGGPALWEIAAEAGVTAGLTVGKGSQTAAVATAGFFTRLGKSISGVF
jgi:hypothetical protein